MAKFKERATIVPGRPRYGARAQDVPDGQRTAGHCMMCELLERAPIHVLEVTCQDRM
jgi:hypothetical protein